MKFIKSLTLKLLVLAFTFVSLSSQNHTIFLYGLMDGEYKKKDMQILYTEIADRIENNDGTIEFWPANTRRTIFQRREVKNFCNSREINIIYETLISSIFYTRLRKHIKELYRETNEPVNIVAFGDGFKILKNFLQIFSEKEYNYINKAIIISTPKLIARDLQNRRQKRSTESLYDDIPFVREIISAEEALCSYHPNREYKYEEESSYYPESEYSYYDTESEIDYAESEYISEEATEYYSDEDPEIESIATDLSGADLSGADLSGADLSETNPYDTDLSNKVVVVNAEEYLKLLKQQPTDRSCCDWFTADRIGALAKAGVLIATTVVALV